MSENGDKVRGWEAAADAALEANEAAMGADGLGLTARQLRQLAWEGLCASVPQYRSAFEAQQIYFNWFGETPDGTAESTGA